MEYKTILLLIDELEKVNQNDKELGEKVRKIIKRAREIKVL